MHELDRRPLRGAVLLLALFMPAVAAAGPSAYRQSLTAQSLENGFPRSGVALLKRQPGAGREETAKKLLGWLDARFAGRLSSQKLADRKQDDGHVLSYVSDHGYLEIHDDGTKFRFRAKLNAADSSGSPAAELSENELEKLGRGFLNSWNDLIRVGTKESLTFLGVRVLKDGGAAPQGPWTQKTVARILIFSREIDGLPVIGKGSKIALWLDLKNEPFGLDVDWPAYETMPTQQETLSWEDLKKRVETTAAPLASSDRPVSRFECGYVDLGSQKRSELIQTGCAVFTEGLSPRFTFVPAGVTVLGDPHWPLAEFMAKGKTQESGQNPGPAPDASPTGFQN